MLGKKVYLIHPDDVGMPDELHGRDLTLYLPPTAPQRVYWLVVER